MRYTRNQLQLTITLLCIIVFITMSTPSAQAVDTPQAWLQFSILEIKCLDETNNEVPEWIGDDDMSLGGTIVSRYGVDQIDYRSVGDYEDDDTRLYTDWIFAEIPFDAANDYSRVLLSLVERDPNGGKEAHLAQFMNTEYALTQQKVISDFVTLLDNLGDASYRQPTKSAFFGEFVLLLGFALETAAKAAITEIVSNLLQEWLAQLDDDIFNPQTIDVPDFTDPAITDNEVITGQARFDGFRGSYQVAYQWQVVTKTGEGSQVGDYQPDRSFAETIVTLQALYEAAISNRKIFLPLIADQ